MRFNGTIYKAAVQMSRLDKLIKSFCLEGIEYKPLDECCIILDNQRRPISKNEREAGEYPYYGANGIQDYVNSYIFDGEFILIGEDGSVINENKTPVVNWASGKIWVNNHAHIISEKKGVLLRYLYHYIQTIDISFLIRGNIPKLTKSSLKSLSIPVPPIEIQNEIIQILDNFTKLSSKLTSELKTEIQIRKQHYKYWRNSLLKIDKTDKNVEWKTLGECCALSAGGDLPKNKFSKTKTEKYNIPIYSNSSDKNEIYGYTDTAKITQTCVTIAARGTIGYSVLRTKPFYPIVRLICAIPNNSLDAGYLKYMLETIKFSAPVTGIPQLTVQMISGYKIAIPPLEKQLNIVSILDRLQALCDDIEFTLHKEIETRKKQYEYYRKKILTFQKKVL